MMTERMYQDIGYTNLNGVFSPLPDLWTQPDSDFSAAQAWWQGGYGLRWKYEGGVVNLFPGIPISAFPTPRKNGVVIIGAPEHPLPHNAAIYNADGSLRLRLKAPKPLARHLPGYIHTAEDVAKIEPEGFWQVGWGCGDGITDFGRPWMWAHIGLHCDVYERRYFDPDTGQFDMEHFHTGRL